MGDFEERNLIEVDFKERNFWDMLGIYILEE